MSATEQPPERLVSGQPHLVTWLRRASLEDIFSSASHSQDFSGSRAEYIYVRVRLFALVFAALALLWIPIDLYVLPRDQALPIVGLRLAFSGFNLLLGLWTFRPHSLPLARLRIAAFLLISGMFYVASRLVLGGGVAEEGILLGYSFLPYLMVVLLAIFPLSLIEGVVLSLFAGSFLVGMEAYEQTLLSLPVLGDIWLLGLLAVVAWWAQAAQLHMLLRLYREATRDALTGLVNRRVLTRWMDGGVATAHAEGQPLSVMLFDLDLFKRVNDTYGHLAGDAVLRSFGRILDNALDRSSLIGRYGGEEFLAVLPNTGAEETRLAAERIREACHQAVVKGPEGESIRYTTSIGVAQLHPGESAEALLKRVDDGLYRAKEEGRDLVVVAE